MIKFSDPGYVWFFAVVALFVALVLYSRWRKNQDINLFAGKKLSRRILDDFSPDLKHFKEYLLLGSLLFFGIALIGPQVGKKLTEVKRKGIDIIIALDTSISMNAEDVKPNRLMRAKYETGKFIDGLRGDRVGLVTFAGTSYLQCPLTLDYSAAKLFLDAMDTGVIGTQGTAIADAIGTSLKAFKSEEKKHKVLVIVSDGEDHEGDIPSIAEEAVNEGVIIFSVGIGTLSGAPIPVYDKGE
ncbi:MAG: VWA domain-containing protein, partial [Candidatus Marinimicrobia bacterium]|nr:VWA domain-containing protein [Candidatus Neomarinimicrobiota bacterium]